MERNDEARQDEEADKTRRQGGHGRDRAAWATRAEEYNRMIILKWGEAERKQQARGGDRLLREERKARGGERDLYTWAGPP